jgi:hypothetical protein
MALIVCPTLGTGWLAWLPLLEPGCAPTFALLLIHRVARDSPKE